MRSRPARPATSVVAAGRRLETLWIPPADPNRATLVFLHEGLGSIALWKSFPRDLAQRTGCGALVYSRYGNGFSDVLSDRRPVSYMHDEALYALPEVLEAFAVRDAVLVGHSDGASIALIYAGEIAERVIGVVAEAPHVFVEDVSVESIGAAKIAFETTDLAERMRRYHADASRTFYGWNDVWLSPEFRSWNIRGSVKKVGVPLLLVQGANDEYGTLAQLDAIRADAARAYVDTLVLARCGHAPHRDRPELVSLALESFLSEIPGARRTSK